MLQPVAVSCNLLHSIATWCILLQPVAVYCNLLQSVATSCSMLHPVAICCSLLQLVASCFILFFLMLSCHYILLQHVDGLLQLLNLQLLEYPMHFPHQRWTCMSSLYNQSLESNVEKLRQMRQIMKDDGSCSKDVDWGTIDKDMYFYAAGFNDVWKNQSWERCDFIYGIDNVDEQHWMAYRYNLIEKTVQIYDSMLKGMKQARATVAGRHAAIAPSLYNVNVAKDEDKLDPDVPFKIEYIADVPQQRNGYDCGVYAVKIV